MDSLSSLASEYERKNEKMSKVLSIIVPVYNMERYLFDCLNSVVLPNKSEMYEVIVVDDGSQDASREVMKEFYDKYPTIFRIVEKDNGGYGSCFNCGIQLASGKYVCILDADDYFEISAFQDYLDELEISDADIFLNRCRYFDCSVDMITGYHNPIEKVSGFISVSSDLLKASFIHEMTFRKKLVENVRCPEKTLYSDNLIVIEAMSKASSLYNSNVDLYVYRINRKGQSTDSTVLTSRLGDFEMTLQSIYTQFDDTKKIQTENFDLCSCKIEGLCVLALYITCKMGLKKDFYHMYRSLASTYLKWREIEDWGASCHLRFANLLKRFPFWCSYCVLWIAMHTIKRGWTLQE